MTADVLAGLALFVFVSAITPGPNNLMLLASGMNFGFRRTIPLMLGIDGGFLVLLGAVGLGLGALFTAMPVLHVILKAASVLYIFWLAWRIAQAGPITNGTDSSGRPMSFLEAVAFQWINPKAIAMALTSVSTFTAPENYFPSLGVVLLMHGAINVPCILAWTLFGVSLRRVLSDPRRMKLFNYGMALALVLSVIPLVAAR